MWIKAVWLVLSALASPIFTACPVGRWGVGCSRKCGQCAGVEPSCNITTGKCPYRKPVCLPGFFGELCSKSCPDGKFGPGCYSKCGQCSGGYKQCNVTTGACIRTGPKCEPGWRGKQCKRQCRDGLYGADCTRRCGACAAGSCNKTDGACLFDQPLCKAGYRGKKCKDACEPGTFGQECQWDCGGCYAGVTTCKPQNGACPAGTPRCNVGYWGDSCKACSPGTWGEECGKNCSDHCVRGRLECDARDGTCLGGCGDDYLGDRCEDPRTGFPDMATVIGLAVGGGVLILLLISGGTLLYLYRHRPGRNKSTRDPTYLTPIQKQGEQLTKEAVQRSPTYEMPIPPSDAPERQYIPMPIIHPAATSEVQNEREDFSLYETMLPSSNWSIPAECLLLSNKFMAQGNFGETQLAKWHYMTGSDVTLSVGLKRFKGNGSDERKNQINRQLEKLRSLDRCLNVLTVLGTSLHVHSGDTLLLLEWTEEGSLLDYLRRPRSPSQAMAELSEHILIKFCVDVTLAIAHLSKHQVTKVDVSTKTILLDRNFDAKVTGFVQFDEDDEANKKQSGESARWAAIEYLLYHKYSTASDVWSIGVLMWEVFSLGDTPYAEMTVKELRGRLETGCRLGHPSNAPTSLFVLMAECWQTDPSLRPTFSDIVRRLHDVPLTNLYCPMAVIKEDSVTYSTVD